MDLADRAAETLERMLELQQELRRRAALSVGGVPGVCTNCGQACLPCAVYCDEDCRADHEARQAVHARTRNTLG